jgi:hypothetical protein
LNIMVTAKESSIVDRRTAHNGGLAFSRRIK